jgi:hypothetical protein
MFRRTLPLSLCVGTFLVVTVTMTLAIVLANPAFGACLACNTVDTGNCTGEDVDCPTSGCQFDIIRDCTLTSPVTYVGTLTFGSIPGNSTISLGTTPCYETYNCNNGLYFNAACILGVGCTDFPLSSCRYCYLGPGIMHNNYTCVRTGACGG